MIYCENIVDMKPVFYSSRDFETIFFSHFRQCHYHNCKKKKKKLFPYFGNDIAAIAFFLILRALHTRAHSNTQDSGRKTGQLNFGNAIAEIQRFSLSSFPYSLSCFLTELLPKFSLSPQFPNYFWIVRITQINFEFYNINPKDSFLIPIF